MMMMNKSKRLVKQKLRNKNEILGFVRDDVGRGMANIRSCKEWSKPRDDLPRFSNRRRPKIPRFHDFAKRIKERSLVKFLVCAPAPENSRLLSTAANLVILRMTQDTPSASVKK